MLHRATRLANKKAVGDVSGLPVSVTHADSTRRYCDVMQLVLFMVCLS